MYVVFPPGDTWTGLDLLQACENVIYPGAIIWLILNVFAVVTFYCFKKNRVFPLTVMAWISIENCLYAAYLICKWAPGSLAAVIVYGPSTYSLCFFSLWTDSFNNYACVCLNLLVGLTLYLTICLQKDISFQTNPIYFWCYVGFFWITTITASFALAGTAGGQDIAACASSDLYGEFGALWGFLAIMAIFVVSSCYRAGKIIKAAQSLNSTRHDRRMLYVLVRFTLMVITQSLEIVSIFILQLVQNNTNAVLLKFCLTVFVLAPCLDAAILIFGNRPLIRWTFRNFHSVMSSSSSSSGHEMEGVSKRQKSTSSANSNPSSLGNRTSDII